MPPGSAQTQPAGGDFIVRCFFNTKITAQDPIMAPGDANADHLHDFFGNLAQGTASFPSITSGDNGGGMGTMETGNNGQEAATNCQDSHDTAGYWIPSPYMVTSAGVAAPWEDQNGCTMGCTAGGQNPNFHQRVYYIPNGNGGTGFQEIPDGTIMVTGYPSGCRTVVGSHTPPGCTDPPTTSYPLNPQIIDYSCGADQAKHLATPVSEWPYDCTPFIGHDGDDSYSDGLVAQVRFPYCWDGTTGNFPAPNSPMDKAGMPTEKVPGYVAPWIRYDVWTTRYSIPKRPVNDFAYPDRGGNCTDPNYPDYVVHLQERIHLLTDGQGWGDPSSCIGDGNIDWNSATGANRNAEMSTEQNPNDTGDGDGDANVQLPNGLWAASKTSFCQSARAPNPAPGATALTFACTPQGQGGDPNCDVRLTSPPGSGCGSNGGTCFAGANRPTATPAAYGWETLHADYWQTWQEGVGDLAGVGTDGSGFPSQGYFRDLIEDCANEGTGACSFINTATQTPKGRVFTTSQEST